MSQFDTNDLDGNFWDNRYLTNQIGWDIGYPSPALINYVKSHHLPEEAILIPGAGNSYEAEQLYRDGYKNLTVIDIAPTPISNFLNRAKDFPKEQAILSDFFEHEGAYDLIIEQTFFCALDPTLRSNYIDKMKQLLNPGGKLSGLLFNMPDKWDRPPFGGDLEKYTQLFGSAFKIHEMAICKDSIEPRQGTEFFFVCEKI